MALGLVVMALALAGCGDEPVARGPIETGPTPGEVIQVLTPEPPEEEAPPEEAAADESAEPVETGVGVVEGQVIMGSPTSSFAPVGMEVALEGFTISMETGELETFLTLTAATDVEGAFRFEDVPMDLQHLFYEVSTTFNGVEFSEWAMASAGEPSLTIPLTIYETTTDPSVITVEAMHTVINSHRDVLLVFQLYVFSNSSDRIYIGSTELGDGQTGSVMVPLPPNANEVIFDEDELGTRFVTSGSSAYDTEHVLPGGRSHSISMSYLLPANTREIALPITYATTHVNVLVQPGIRVRSSALTAAGVETIEDMTYDTYTGQDLTPGETLTLRIRIPGEGENTALIILGVGAALAIVGGGAYWIIRSRRPATGLTPQQETLLRQIADLDDAFEAGRINRIDYEARRADLKATLAEDFQSD